MRLTRNRVLLAGAIGVAAVALPVSVPFAATQLGGGVASPSTPPPPDVITYNQTTGTAGTYVEYVPAGNTADATTQTVTPSGKCGTPTVTGTPLLDLAGLLYPPDVDPPGTPDTNDYLGTPSPAPVGSFKQHTGVCAVGAPWTVDNVPPRGEEALDFSVGANTAMGTNRIFSDAQIALQNEGFWPWSGTIPVQLVEYLGGSQVATQACTIPVNPKSTTIVDTSTNAACTGSTALTGFDTVEIEVPQDDNVRLRRRNFDLHAGPPGLRRRSPSPRRPGRRRR